MTQDITLSLDESRVQFIKEYAEKKGTTASKIVDDYLKLFQDIEEFNQKRNLHPWVQEVSGMVSTGRNETKDTIFE